MASRAGLTWDSMVKAGTEMMDIASASLQRTMKIQEVTSTKDNDSQPAYALNELVQACNKNSEEARAIAAALLRRASSTNAVIKWKALRAIRYICQNSSNTQFKKACGGPQASVIREAISWSGSPHPQLGNALNLRVREAAKETLDEVFRVSSGPAAGAAGSAGASLQGRIQGYGSTTGGKIQGASPSGVAGTSTTGFSSAGGTGTGGKKYGGISSDDYFAGSSRGRWSTWSNASQSGLGANGSASTTTGASTPPRAAAGSTAGTSAARAAIGSEEAVVEELCRGSGGVQPRPTPEALRAFVAKASQLDPEVIALELTHKLFNTMWQVRVRALEGMHAIAEAVKARGGGHPLEATTESLRSVTEAFAGVLGHENAAVRAAAGRVMRALGVESAVAAAVAAAPAAAAQPAAAAGGDLLGGFDDVGDAPAAAAPAPVAAPASQAPELDDLLGGLDDGAGAGADAGAAGGGPAQGDMGGLDGLDGLAGFGTGAPSAPAAAASPAVVAPPAGGAAVTDMFAGLTVAGTGAGGAPAATPAAADPLDSLLGGLSDPPASAAAPMPNGTTAGVAAVPVAASDPLGGLGDTGLVSLMPTSAPVSTPGSAPVAAGAGVLPGAADMGMHGVHALSNGGQVPGGMGQFGAQQVGMQPGMFGSAQAPGVNFGGMQPGVGYPGAGMQPGYGMQPPAGAGNGQTGMMGGQQMHGMPGQSAGGVAGGGMGLPQGSGGAPIAQHGFAHATGSLGGHKDAFDFVNDVIKKPGK